MREGGPDRLQSVLETYIVRIYRRDAQVPARLVGVVEPVGGRGRRAFGSREELWTILAGPPAQPPAERRAPGGRPARRKGA